MDNEIGLRELRQDASNVIKRVEAGEEIIVTVSGRPAAKLVPITYGSLRVSKPATRKIDWTKYPRVSGGPSIEEMLDDLKGDR